MFVIDGLVKIFADDTNIYRAIESTDTRELLQNDVGKSEFTFWGHHKIGLYLVAISMHFRVFSSGQGTESGTFFGLPQVQIFFWGA